MKERAMGIMGREEGEWEGLGGNTEYQKVGHSCRFQNRSCKMKTYKHLQSQL